jgi:DNA-binding NtrC family response regulator
VIAATNHDLQTAVEHGTFRQDLFYRLNVFPLEVPPLRERRDDIPVLVQYLIARYARKAGKTIRRVNRRTLDHLQSYPWPGNVRELKNYVQRAFIMASPDSDSTAAVPLQISLSKPSSGTAVTIPFGTSLAEADRQLILATLEQCGGVKTRAAEILGISLKTLYNRLVEYGDEANKSGAEDDAASAAGAAGGAGS